MNEQQLLTSRSNQKSSTLPSGDRLKHQATFDSSSRPDIPAGPFVRSNTISVPDTSNTNNIRDNNSGSKEALQTERHSSPIRKPPPPPTLQPLSRQSSNSFSHSKSIDDKNTANSQSDSKRPSSLYDHASDLTPLENPPPKTTPTKTVSPSQDTSPDKENGLNSTEAETEDNKEVEENSNKLIEKPEEEKKASPRPPPPTFKPPPRPNRPFPPPPQARMLEARLAKKKPPPKIAPVKFIDTRTVSSTSLSKTTPTKDEDTSTRDEDMPTKIEDTPTSPIDNDPPIRDLKEMRIECSNFSSIPKMPPRPLTSPTRTTPKKVSFGESVEENETNETVTKEDKASRCSNGTTSALKQSSLSVEEDDVFRPLASPRGERKFMNKMKSSFRSLTQRKKNRNRGEGSPSMYRPKSSGQLYDQDKYPDRLPTGIVSPLVVLCIAYLNHKESLDEQGLFRIPGDMSTMKRYRASFVRGEEVDLSECRDPHTIAGLLKLHFREQRQCIIPGDAVVQGIVQAVEKRNVQDFKVLIESVDVEAQAGIRMLAELLKKVTENSETNLMTSGTLATSCGPSFFPRIPPSCANAVLKFLTDNCDLIFGT